MAPLRGGRSRGGRGGRGGASRGSGKLARSGIRTRSGYRRFDSQRVKEVDEDESPDPSEGPGDSDHSLSDGDDESDAEIVPVAKSYNTLLQSFAPQAEEDGPRRKRRKIEAESESEDMPDQASQDQILGMEDVAEDSGSEDPEVEEPLAAEDLDVEEDEKGADPYEIHFANPEENDLSRRLKSIQQSEWRIEKQSIPKVGNITVSTPGSAEGSGIRKSTVRRPSDLLLKKRLLDSAERRSTSYSSLDRAIAPYIFNYADLFYGGRTPQDCDTLIEHACLHALNHVLKGRDKVIKNSTRLAHATSENSNGPDIDARDQGFTRPKVLILTETRQMCYRYGVKLAQLFGPDQQENKQRFDTSFNAETDDKQHRDMPDDHRELFGGNTDNKFVTSVKLTRKTMKYFSSFYTSDILLASPLGLRGILENEDAKKKDYDFLSSIEVVIVDQADAMAMQSWSNVEAVFEHLNLPLKEAHGCDFSRVRQWYLDGHTKYLRQNIIFSAYVTPEMNRLFNTYMQNIAGKAKLVPAYDSSSNNEVAISGTSNALSGAKQTFSRFDCASPAADPDARFKYFTTAILPSLLRLPRPSEGGQGIIIFIPSYYDFLRLRNHFATSNQTANISFGTICEYSTVPQQQRARAHFLSGRHSFLLYTQRAHHFFRLRIKGVRRVVMYGLPENPVFYEEIVGGFLGTSLQEQRLQPEEAGARSLFSRFDVLALERVVGSERVRSMVGGRGDVFEFV